MMKALLIDQPPHIRRYLESAGYKTLEAPDELQAERLLEKETDISLMICNAPASEKDFITLAASARNKALSGYIFVIVVVNSADQHRLLGSLAKAGADDLLANPVTWGALQIKLNIANRLISLENRLRFQKETSAVFQKSALLIRHLPGVFHEMNNPISFIGSNLSTMRSYVNKIVELSTRCENILTALEADVSRLPPEVQTAIKDYRGFSEESDIAFILPDMNALLDENQGGIQSIQSLVRNLQTIVLADDALDDNTVTADINDCLMVALNVAWNAIKYKATVQTTYGHLPQIPFPPGRLSQAFLIILDTAIRSISTFGSMSIHTTDDANSSLVRIDVMNDNAKEPINFSPTANAIMDIAHNILSAHGGMLSVNKNPDEGIGYVISFPHPTTAAHHEKP